MPRATGTKCIHDKPWPCSVCERDLLRAGQLSGPTKPPATREDRLLVVRRRGDPDERRLSRACPGCGSARFLYCAERSRCVPGTGEVCADSLCVECGWEGSTPFGAPAKNEETSR